MAKMKDEDVLWWVILVILPVGVWLISVMGARLDEQLARFLRPVGAATSPFWALTAFFILLRLAIGPYELNHARIDRAKLRIRPSFVDPKAEPKSCRLYRMWAKAMEEKDTYPVVASDRCFARSLMVCVIDVIAIFMLARAVTSEVVGWSADMGWLFWPGSGWFWKIVLLGILFIPDFVAVAASEALSFSVVARLKSPWPVGQARGKRHKPAGGFLGERNLDAIGLTQCIPARFVAYFVPFIVLAIMHRSNPFFPTLMLAFVIGKSLVGVGLTFASVMLDRYNDQWVARLAGELTSSDPEQRLAAAQALGKLARWAWPVRAQVALASRDADPRVRQEAAAVLRNIVPPPSGDDDTDDPPDDPPGDIPVSP